MGDSPFGLYSRESRVSQIKIFISHSSKDKALARRLVRAIRTRVDIQSNEIRCSSVQGYRLPVGAHTASRLKEELTQSVVVIGIITPYSLKSSYVLFELGAAWGLGIATFPLLAKGAKVRDLPGPLCERNVARLTNSSETIQALDDLWRLTGLDRRDENDALLNSEVKKVVKHAKD